MKEVNVRDLMTTDVLSVRRSARISEASKEMFRADVRHLPVLDKDGRVVGVLSDRDIFRADSEDRVADHMSRDVLTVRPNSRTCEATEIMLDHKVGSVVVVDESRHLVGILTETDFLRVAHAALGGDTLVSED